MKTMVRERESCRRPLLRKLSHERGRGIQRGKELSWKEKETASELESVRRAFT